MIGIIAAMQFEAQAIKNKLENAETRVISGVEYATGKLFGKNVVCAVCGIGKVNAAVCTQTMILAYRPDVVINTGVGGGLDKTLRVFDVVAGTSAVQHDVDTTAIGDGIGFVSTVNKTFFMLDEDLKRKLVSSMRDMGVNEREGIIATGDQFVCNADRKKWIIDTFGASVCDMEGCAIAHTCCLNDIPCAVLRAISDSANEEASMSYEEFAKKAAEQSVKVLFRYVEAYA